ncbi:MAG TPA: methyltransferase domain-containing protein [Candidatus Acidoferrales bacterium]|nr:methyltransferase domain-containing protein [Candidatus Acidoferrales bacterium]
MNQDEHVHKSDDEISPLNLNSKRLLKNYYDCFYESSEFQYYTEKTTRRFLKALLRKGRVKTGAAVLDVGCGTAFYTEQLRIIGFNAIGIDISRVGILKGHSKYPFVPLIVGDISAMPLMPASFDVLFLSGCSLMNIPDVQAIRSNVLLLMNYLNKNGIFIFIGKSDFSGETLETSGWINHTYDEILSFVDREKVRTDGPYLTNIRLLSAFGPSVLNKASSSFIKKLPLNRKWSFVYFIRRRS